MDTRIALGVQPFNLAETIAQAEAIKTARADSAIKQQQAQAAQLKAANEVLQQSLLAELYANPDDLNTQRRFINAGGPVSTIGSLLDLGDKQTQRTALSQMPTPPQGSGFTPESWRALGVLTPSERAKVIAETITPAKAGFGQQYGADGPMIAPSFAASQAQAEAGKTRAVETEKLPFTQREIAMREASQNRQAAYSGSITRQNEAFRSNSEQVKPTEAVRNALAAGYEPGTLEFSRAVLGDRMPAMPGQPVTLKPEQQFGQENTLRDEYVKITKLPNEAISNYRSMRDIAQDGTGASDVALGFAFFKTIDPTSTVREGEYAQIGKSMGLPSQAVAELSRISNGERLTPEARQNLVNVAKKYADSAKAQIDRANAEYNRLAKSYNLEAQRVVIDLGGGLTATQVPGQLPVIDLTKGQ
jgi:hypothetical protein